MDEVLLRRLVGTTVLLAAAFVLASLLPEPAPSLRAADGTERVVRFDLTTGEVADSKQQAVAPTAPPKAPEPPRNALQLQESLALTPPANWYVQVGSFGNQANAQSVLVKLYQLGMPTVIENVQVKKDLWYRVRVGPYPAETKAREALAAVRRQGYDEAKIVHIDG